MRGWRNTVETVLFRIDLDRTMSPCVNRIHCCCFSQCGLGSAKSHQSTHRQTFANLDWARHPIQLSPIPTQTDSMPPVCTLDTPVCMMCESMFLVFRQPNNESHQHIMICLSASLENKQQYPLKPDGTSSGLEINQVRPVLALSLGPR